MAGGLLSYLIFSVYLTSVPVRQRWKFRAKFANELPSFGKPFLLDSCPDLWTDLERKRKPQEKPEVGAVLASLSSPQQREPGRLAFRLLASIQLSTLSRSGCVLSKFSLYMILSSLPESLWIYLLPALSPTLYLASFSSFFRSVCSNLVIGFLLCWENMGLYVLASQTLLADGYKNFP